MSLDGRVAIVTGAESGIGAATCRRLAEDGARIVMGGLTQDGLEAARDELPDGSTSASIVVGDITRPETSNELVATAIDRFGGVDILVNSAGIANIEPAATMSLEDWRRVVDVNLNGTFYAAQSAGRAMIDRGGGSIVNVASMAGLAGMPNHAAYVASKHGVVGLTKALAVEWASRGIRVNALCPGLTETEMVKGAAEQAPEIFEERRQRNLLGRLATPEEQAEMIGFLVSDSASYVNGLIANVDGGGLALYSGYGRV